MTDLTALATEMVSMLERSGFKPEAIRGTRELVYSRPINGDVRVAVYTTIENGRCRAVGSDAIRVVALYTTKKGQIRGIAKADKRVNRVGTVEAVVDRTLTRMRDVYRAGRSSERCGCGAPKFISKKGNAVCAELCWLKS
jgi:hypothetical protein